MSLPFMNIDKPKKNNCEDFITLWYEQPSRLRPKLMGFFLTVVYIFYLTSGYSLILLGLKLFFFNYCSKFYFYFQFQILCGSFMFLENDTSRSNDSFTLVYKSPQNTDKSRLTLSFQVGDIRLIWNR